MSGSQEIWTFQESYSTFNHNFLTYFAYSALNWVLSVTKKNRRITEIFALLPFLAYTSLIKDLISHKYTVFSVQKRYLV